MAKIFFSFLFLAITARADFTGSWEGQGIVRYDHHTQVCPDISVVIWQDVSEFTLVEAVYPCVTTIFKKYQYQIKGKDLFEGSVKVGWLKPSEFYVYSKVTGMEIHGELQKDNLTFSQDSGNFHAKSNLKK